MYLSASAASAARQTSRPKTYVVVPLGNGLDQPKPFQLNGNSCCFIAVAITCIALGFSQLYSQTICYSIHPSTQVKDIIIYQDAASRKCVKDTVSTSSSGRPSISLWVPVNQSTDSTGSVVHYGYSADISGGWPVANSAFHLTIAITTLLSGCMLTKVNPQYAYIGWSIIAGLWAITFVWDAIVVSTWSHKCNSLKDNYTSLTYSAVNALYSPSTERPATSTCYLDWYITNVFFESICFLASVISAVLAYVSFHSSKTDEMLEDGNVALLQEYQ